MQVDNSDILQQFIDGVLAQIGENMKQQGSYVSGKTFSLLTAEVDAAKNTARIIDNSDGTYFKTLIYGRGPTKGGGGNGGVGFLQQIKNWIAAKGITPYPDSKGRTPTPDQLAFLIYRSINQKGTWLYSGNRNMTFGGATNPTELLLHGIRPEREDAFKTAFQTKYAQDLTKIINELLKPAA